MAKGSGGGLVVVAAGIGALACGYLYLSGKLPGFGQGTPDAGAATDAGKDAGGAVVDQGSSLVDWYFSQGWAYTGIVAAALAALGVITWKKIGNWGRTLVLVCLAIVVTVLVKH